jgi:hypothetical protein
MRLSEKFVKAKNLKAFVHRFAQASFDKGFRQLVAGNCCVSGRKLPFATLSTIPEFTILSL